MKTLHVAGYKNSGKTTLVSHWITLLADLGHRVAVLKHHGHGGAPELPPAHTDTVQFLDSIPERGDEPRPARRHGDRLLGGEVGPGVGSHDAAAFSGEHGIDLLGL